MAATIISFRWLDLLEKEFDKSFIDLDFILGDVEFEENEEFGTQAKVKMNALSSCFAQLAHKAQTIFQINAKLEAEIVNLKHNLSVSQASCQVIKSENEEYLLRLHSTQIELQKKNIQSETLDANYLDNIHKKIITELTSRREILMNSQTKKEELVLLRRENDCLKKDLVSLQGDLCGAKLTTKYLDKELSGRIQQLQLLRNHIEGNQHEHLWKQLESEIQLQRHKTIVRACRQNILTKLDGVDCAGSSQSGLPKPSKANFHRYVILERRSSEELGITITGGVDHGIPVLISALNGKSVAGLTDQIYVGDAILSVNGVCLREATQSKAAAVLSSQQGSITLELVFIPGDEAIENDLLPDDDITNRYKIFDDDVLSLADSLRLTQNGRLSRASIESIRGSTENILDTFSNASEAEKCNGSLCEHFEKCTLLLDENYVNSDNCCEQNDLKSVSRHNLLRNENNQVQSLNRSEIFDTQNIHVGIANDAIFDNLSSIKNNQTSELFNYEF